MDLCVSGQPCLHGKFYARLHGYVLYPKEKKKVLKLILNLESKNRTTIDSEVNKRGLPVWSSQRLPQLTSVGPSHPPAQIYSSGGADRLRSSEKELLNGLALTIPACFFPGHREDSQLQSSQCWGWAHASVDRFAVLYDLWTWEANLLESKYQV